MEVIQINLSIKYNIKYHEIIFFIGYGHNHTGCMYCTISLFTKWVVLNCDIIWLKNTYGTCMPIFEHTKSDGYAL